MSPFYAGLWMGRGDELGWIRVSMVGFLTFSIFFEQEGSASFVFLVGWIATYPVVSAL